jgi:hypothetical protein
MLDRNSPLAREFVLFKSELYQMYEIQNRSIHEHELYSFNIERRNLKWLYQANLNFIEETQTQNLLERISEHTSLKGAVFKRKVLNPRRVKGLTGFVSSLGIYTYMPYMAVYLGSSIPFFAAIATGLYGMF